MRVKHWAGYGCVEAKHTYKSEDVNTIEVIGNHERGLLPHHFDTRDWDRWLGKRFHLKPAYRVLTNELWSDKDNQDRLIVTIHSKEAYR